MLMGQESIFVITIGFPILASFVSITLAHLTMFEFGGHANLAGLSLLDIRASLDSPIYFPEWPTIEICCIFVPKSVQICLQSSKICPPNSNVDKCEWGVIPWGRGLMSKSMKVLLDSQHKS